MQSLSIMAGDVLKRTAAPMTPLWIAASNDDLDTLAVLLSLEGVLEDRPAPDGSTAFALTLGHQRLNFIYKMLEVPKRSSDEQDGMNDMVSDAKESAASKEIAAWNRLLTGIANADNAGKGNNYKCNNNCLG